MHCFKILSKFYHATGNHGNLQNARCIGSLCRYKKKAECLTSNNRMRPSQTLSYKKNIPGTNIISHILRMLTNETVNIYNFSTKIAKR